MASQPLRSARVQRIARLFLKHRDARAVIALVIPVAGFLLPAGAAGDERADEGKAEEDSFHIASVCGVDEMPKRNVSRIAHCKAPSLAYVASSQKTTGAYWFRLKDRVTDGMPRKPGWPRYQSWAKHTKAKTEELALAA